MALTSARFAIARLGATRLAYTFAWKAPTVSRLAIQRMGAKRMGYAQPIFRAQIGGVWRNTSTIRIEGFTITDELDSTPNTATARVQGFAPHVGEEVAFYLGDTSPSHTIFRGRILTCTQVYDALPSQLCYDLSCISGEWRLNQYKVTTRYVSTSATAIVLNLCAVYAPWVNTSGVETGLPTLSEITFTNEDLSTCFDRLKDRQEIGGRWLLDYADVLWFGQHIEPGSSAIHPITDADQHGLIAIAAETDLSQARTRVRVEAGGSQTLAELNPGETLLPVEDPVWYDPLVGGTVVSGPQRIAYTGIDEGGGGALVGTSARPTNGPTITPITGTGIESGLHYWSVVFVSGSGKTLPSPITGLNMGGVTVQAPGTAGGVASDSRSCMLPPVPPYSESVGVITNYTFFGSLDAGARYDYCFTYYDSVSGTETTPSVVFGNTLDTGRRAMKILRAMAAAPPSGLVRRWYRTVGNASPKVYYLRSTGDMPLDADTNYFLDYESDSTLNLSIGPPLVNEFGSGDLDLGARYDYQYTFYEVATGRETTPFPFNPAGTGATLAYGRTRMLLLKSNYQAAPAGLVRRWYRTQGNASPKVFYLRSTDDMPTHSYFTGDFVDDAGDATLNTSVQPPVVNSFTGNQAALSAIAIGPAGTVSREVYRSTVNTSSPQKLLTTIANNTATTYTDSTPDASLGATAPVTDTAALVAEIGSIAAGATEIKVTSVGAFRAAGGWIVAGGQMIRYTGRTSTTLTGIPATGSGALGGPLNYGSEVLAVPMLLGLPASGAGAIVYAIGKGDDVNILVTQNDQAAQTLLASLLSTAGTSHNGVVEDYIQDRRLSKREAEARGNARLLEVKDPEVTMAYRTRDQTTRAGRDVTITLTAPAISGTFKIQRVTISEVDPLMQMWPVRAVDASSRKFSFEQLLRLVKGV